MVKLEGIGKAEVFIDGEERVMGIGKFLIKDEDMWQITTVSLEFLERVVKMLKICNPDKKNAYVDIAISRDTPLLVGRYDPQRKMVAGIVLAPICDIPSERSMTDQE